MFTNRVEINTPKPNGAFSKEESLALLQSYRYDPSSVICPLCGPDNIEVLGFIFPEITSEGIGIIKAPTDRYAAALYCHGCFRVVGVVPNIPE